MTWQCCVIYAEWSHIKRRVRMKSWPDKRNVLIWPTENISMTPWPAFTVITPRQKKILFNTVRHTHRVFHFAVNTHLNLNNLGTNRWFRERLKHSAERTKETRGLTGPEGRFHTCKPQTASKGVTAGAVPDQHSNQQKHIVSTFPSLECLRANVLLIHMQRFMPLGWKSSANSRMTWASHRAWEKLISRWEFKKSTPRTHTSSSPLKVISL